MSAASLSTVSSISLPPDGPSAMVVQGKLPRRARQLASQSLKAAHDASQTRNSRTYHGTPRKKERPQTERKRSGLATSRRQKTMPKIIQINVSARTTKEDGKDLTMRRKRKTQQPQKQRTTMRIDFGSKRKRDIQRRSRAVVQQEAPAAQRRLSVSKYKRVGGRSRSEVRRRKATATKPKHSKRTSAKLRAQRARAKGAKKDKTREVKSHELSLSETQQSQSETSSKPKSVERAEHQIKVDAIAARNVPPAHVIRSMSKRRPVESVPGPIVSRSQRSVVSTIGNSESNNSLRSIQSVYGWQIRVSQPNSRSSVRSVRSPTSTARSPEATTPNYARDRTQLKLGKWKPVRYY